MEYHKEWLNSKVTDKSTPSHLRVGWNSWTSQMTRFSVLGSYIHPKDRVLDVGCGLGAFHSYLNMAGIVHEYHGIDLISENIQEAKELHENAKFKTISLEDYVKISDPESFDVVVASGIFSYSTMDDARNVFDGMMKLSKRLVACNFLSIHGGFFDGKSSYYDPKEIMNWFEGMPFVIDHSYLMHDFTVVVSKDTNL